MSDGSFLTVQDVQVGVAGEEFRVRKKRWGYFLGDEVTHPIYIGKYDKAINNKDTLNQPV